MPQIICKCIVVAVTVAVTTIINNQDKIGSTHDKS